MALILQIRAVDGAAREHGAVTGQDAALVTFHRAAIAWAGGARGQVLVDAAADALAAGLDSPTLRVLAGAPRVSADEEATELGPEVFEELGVPVAERLSSVAIVEAARQRAGDYLDGHETSRELTKALWHAYVRSDYDDELSAWSGLDDWYDMLDGGVITGRSEVVDAAVLDAARALVERRSADAPPAEALFVGKTASSRRPRRPRRLWRRQT